MPAGAVVRGVGDIRGSETLRGDGGEGVRRVGEEAAVICKPQRKEKGDRERETRRSGEAPGRE